MPPSAFSALAQAPDQEVQLRTSPPYTGLEFNVISSRADGLGSPGKDHLRSRVDRYFKIADEFAVAPGPRDRDRAENAAVSRMRRGHVSHRRGTQDDLFAARPRQIEIDAGEITVSSACPSMK